jgi:hypothetical protein
MQPMQRAHKQIVNAIDYSREPLGGLTREELGLPRETADTLIIHVEGIKIKHEEAAPESQKESTAGIELRYLFDGEIMFTNCCSNRTNPDKRYRLGP